MSGYITREFSKKFGERIAGSCASCRSKFLRFFHQGFRDAKYFDWERGYKWRAHEQWEAELNKKEYQALLTAGKYEEIAARAVRIESKTNLLFSFEKMALRDAVKVKSGAKAFAIGLYEFLYGRGGLRSRFENWIEVIAQLPRKQTRVLTWPVVTVFGFIAQPQTHFFLKPNVTRLAAKEYGVELPYNSKPSWEIYEALLSFAERVCSDLKDLKPHDMMDIQSFLWVLGSDEYAEE